MPQRSCRTGIRTTRRRKERPEEAVVKVSTAVVTDGDPDFTWRVAPGSDQFSQLEPIQLGMRRQGLVQVHEIAHMGFVMVAASM